MPSRHSIGVAAASSDASSSKRSAFSRRALLKQGFLAGSKSRAIVKPDLMSGASMTSTCVWIVDCDY